MRREPLPGPVREQRAVAALALREARQSVPGDLPASAVFTHAINALAPMAEWSPLAGRARWLLVTRQGRALANEAETGSGTSHRPSPLKLLAEDRAAAKPTPSSSRTEPPRNGLREAVQALADTLADEPDETGERYAGVTRDIIATHLRGLLTAHPGPAVETTPTIERAAEVGYGDAITVRHVEAQPAGGPCEPAMPEHYVTELDGQPLCWIPASALAPLLAEAEARGARQALLSAADDPSMGPAGSDGASCIPSAFRVLPTRYGDCELPDKDVFEVTVAWRGQDPTTGQARWAVTHRGRCLAADGTWQREPRPSARDQDFLSRCRYSIQDALGRAIAEVDNVKVNGRTLAEWVTHDDAQAAAQDIPRGEDAQRRLAHRDTDNAAALRHASARDPGGAR